MLSEEVEAMKRNGLRWTGQFLGAVYDLDSMSIERIEDSYAVNLKGKFKYNGAYYNFGSEENIEEYYDYIRMVFLYNQVENTWVIDNISQDVSFDEDNAVELYEENPKLERVNEANTIVEQDFTFDQVSEFVRNYVFAGVEAINKNDFTLVESYIDPNGPKYKEQMDYIQYLNNKKITEEVIKFEVSNVVKHDEKVFLVDTYEEFTISYGDGTQKHKKFNTKYEVIVEEDRLIINELIITKEVE